MERNKKAIVGLIFAITSVLAGLSIYVSWELRRDISPEDSSADTTTIVPSEVIPTKDISKKKVVPTKTTPTKVIPSTVIATTRPSGAGTIATPQPSRPLPSTALINNRADAAIMGSLMILVGLILYKKYLYFGDKDKA
jgi:hypothetical protein